MLKTSFRDLAALACGTLGMLTLAVSLILTPLPAWGEDGAGDIVIGCVGCSGVPACNGTAFPCGGKNCSRAAHCGGCWCQLVGTPGWNGCECGI